MTNAAVDWRSLPRVHQVLVYTAGVLDSLARKGLLTPGETRISDEGRIVYQEMIDEGWAPTEQELIWGVRALQTTRLRGRHHPACALGIARAAVRSIE